MPEPPRNTASPTGDSRHFDTDHLVGDLRAHSVRGGAYTLSSQICKFVVALATITILARLLTPDDFGLLTMVMVVTGLVALFKDLGLAKATIQRMDVSHAQISTLFWINVGTGLVMAVATVVVAPVVAWFYRDPRLTEITFGMAGLFLFGGLTVQHQALLRRQMKFGPLAVVEVLSPAIGAAAGIIAALRGAGYWSLVVLHVSTAACLAVGVWIACRWRPGLPVRGSGIRPMLAYGGRLTAFSVVNYAARNVDKMLIGRFFESAAAGFYGKAYQLMLLPVQQLNTPASGVAIPTLSRLQNDPERYRAYYRRGIELLVALGMPAVVFLFVTADKMVLLVLGPQWMEAVPIFRVLAPAAFLSTFNVATGWVYLSLGHTDRLLRWGMIAAVTMLTALGVGLRWGPIGVAVAVSTATLVLRYPGLVFCFKNTPVCVRDVFRAIWRPALAALLAGAVTMATSRYVHLTETLILELTIDLMVFCGGYIVVWSVLPDGLKTLGSARRLAWEMFHMHRKIGDVTSSRGE